MARFLILCSVIVASSLALQSPVATAHEEYERHAYVVRYRMEREVRVHTRDHREAHRLEDQLEDLGVRAEIDDEDLIIFHTRHSIGRRFASYREANHLHHWLEHLGFSVDFDDESRSPPVLNSYLGKMPPRSITTDS